MDVASPGTVLQDAFSLADDVLRQGVQVSRGGAAPLTSISYVQKEERNSAVSRPIIPPTPNIDDALAVIPTVHKPQYANFIHRILMADSLSFRVEAAAESAHARAHQPINRTALLCARYFCSLATGCTPHGFTLGCIQGGLTSMPWGDLIWWLIRVERFRPQGISDIITVPGLINVDFADVKAIMSNSGTLSLTRVTPCLCPP